MPEVRAAVLRRDAERLALAGGDVGAVRAGRREDGERDRLDDRDEQRAGGVGELADPRHRLEQPEEVGVRGDDAGDRPVGVGQHRARAPRGPSCPAASPSATSGISSSSRPPPKYVAQRRPVVRMDAAADTRTRSRRVARQVMRAASAVAAAPS